MVKDPLRPARGAANLGSAALGRSSPDSASGPRWELGTVLAYNSATHTAAVRTDSGRPLQDVPQIKPTAGSYDHLGTGTQVVVSWDLGFPAIIGCIDFVGARQVAIPATSLTGVEGVGSDDPTQPTEGSNSYRAPNAPTDMGPGDWAHVGSLGNHVAVLEGGLTLLGSPTACIQSNGPTGTLRQIARRVEQFTDFGQMRVENLEGRTSFILRAGSNQTTETGLDEEHWTIRLDLGATGDIFDFRIVEPEGRQLFRLHAGSDGRVQLHGDGGVDISSGKAGTATAQHDVAGDRAARISGDDTQETQGNASHTVDGALSSIVTGNAVNVVGGESTTYVGKRYTIAVGEDETRVVGGDYTRQVGSDDSVNVAGDQTVRVAKSIKVEADSNISLTASQTSKLDGRLVVLGTQGKHPAPKFDVFLRDLKGFLGDLTSAIGNLTPSSPLGLAVAVAKINLFKAKVASAITYTSRKVRND